MVTRLSGQVLYYPYVEGANVRVVSGSAISGEALANVGGNPSDVLFATGQLTVTSPIEQIGYQHVVARGHLVAPKSNRAEAAEQAGLDLRAGRALECAAARL